MRCRECGGDVNLKKGVRIKTTDGKNRRRETAYTCKRKRCGRLYWEDGKEVFDPTNRFKAYLRNGKVIAKKIRKRRR